MYQKLLLPVFFMLVNLIQLSAKPVDPQTAEKKATAFFKEYPVSSVQSKTSSSTTLRLVYTCTEKSTNKSLAPVYYYVYNRNEKEGFVIVSGDDRTKPILGYSDEGSFMPGNIPANFQYWLDCYKSELQELSKKEAITVTNHSDYNPIQPKEYKMSVNPLLENISYGQDEPYNNLCPLIPKSKNRTVTGCVATAMAQVMRYHQWPKKGKGTNSYTTRDLKIPLQADFGNTSYDWDHLLESYSKKTNVTQEQKEAVATLMLHCGIAVNMNYNLSSGASIYDIVAAMMNYFDYDPSMQFYHRGYFTAPQWSDLLKEELSNDRPVIYNGISSSGGHSFICDGYDANGLFHINWGWDGTSNGYFELSALTPEVQGTGGSLGGFNMEQSVILGIRPSDGTQAESNYLIRLTRGLSSNKKEVAQGETAVIRLGYRNLGAGSFYGYHGLGLYTPDGTFVKTISSGVFGKEQDGIVIKDTLYTGTGSDRLQWKIQVNTDLPEGSFRIYPIYQFGDQPLDNNWTIMPGEVSMASYLNAEINESGIQFSTPEIMPKLELTEFQVTGKLYQAKAGRFKFTVKNSGNEYTGYVTICIEKEENDGKYQFIGPEGITIQNGETKTYELTGKIEFTPGKYIITVQYDGKDGNLRQIGEATNVTIEETPSEAPKLTILGLDTDLDPSRIYKNEEIIFKATLKNEGGYAEAKAMAVIFRNNGNSGDTFGNQPVYLEKGEEREYTFRGTTMLESGKYYARIYLQTDDNDWDSAKPLANNKLSFTLVGEESDLINETTLSTTIYPNPATDYLYINSENLSGEINIYNLSGQLILKGGSTSGNRLMINVIDLPAGTYLVRINTSEQVINRKFIKK